MARQQQNTVDYFPFLCKEGEAMFYIENKYGNDGYASWIKILRQLAVTNYHYLNLSEYKSRMFLSSKCKISEDLLVEIITDLCFIGEFNKELWEQNKIVFSEKFIENIKDAYARRKNECINMFTLCIHLNTINVQSAYILSQIAYANPKKQYINPHSIVEYSIVKDSRVDNSRVDNTIEVFFDEDYQLEYTLNETEKIYGAEYQRKKGGMSEHAIKTHCTTYNLKYPKNGI